MEEIRYYGLSKDTKIYVMNSWCIKIPKGSPVKAVKNALGEVIVSIKVRKTIILLKRERINDKFNPIGVYVNGELFGYANYKNPPFPLSLIP